jgi:transcriptional regulator with PAS, ATPase and Fis domain
MKILISWLAFNNDFTNNEVLKDGPTFNYHRYNYNYDKHIILSTAAESNLMAEKLLNSLLLEFPSRQGQLEIKYMDVRDVIDINLIKTKVEKVLLDLRDHEIDIFFSPGTSAMQVSWYICHTTLGLKTKLMQSRPARFSKSKKPEFLEISTSYSTVPVTAIIREQNISNGAKTDSSYLISDGIKPAYEKALKIAQTDKVTTLIIGDSGTGKEHLSKYIHDNSIRNNNSFIAVNCSAFNENLLEARLFGFKKNAFTGADKDQKGLFEEVDGGTIFLDEIGDISPYMQQSLLRVLQEQEILPIGFNKPVKINVRIIAATNKNLVEMCRHGRFRWDLYYRLTVTELSLPSLNERGLDDKSQLIEYFIESKKTLFKRRKRIALSKEAFQALLLYSFPGNIRELENLIEQLYVFFDGEVSINDLPDRIVKPESQNSMKWMDVEKELIAKVLNMMKGNQNRTSKILGYGSINTLRKKIKEYEIDITNIIPS